MEDQIKVMYILSPSYSGSTLLSLLLGNQKNVFGAGELFVFSKHPDRIQALSESKCSCEKVSWQDCTFWSEINEHLVAHHHLTLDQLDIESEDVDIFQKHNAALLASIKQSTKTSFILDSSKIISRYNQYLQAGFNVSPIVLRRSPCAVVYSWIKRGYNWLEVAHYYAHFYEEICKQVSENSLKINYEKLVNSPKANLKKALQIVGNKSTDISLNWNHQVYHHLSGNPMLYENTSQLTIDESWKKELNTFKKIVIRLVTLSVIIDKAWFYRFWRTFIHIIFWIFHTRTFKWLKSKVIIYI